MKPKKNESVCTLLLKPRPYSGESLVGYQLRVAEANGYKCSTWQSLHQLRSTTTAMMSHQRANKLATILNLGEEEVTRLAYMYDSGPPGSYLRYFGQRLHPRHVRLTHPVICPICLQECAATNGFWDLKYAVVCPFHSTRLIDICQRCGSAVSWKRSNICICPKCKFDYRKSVTEPACAEVQHIVGLLYSKANISLLAPPAVHPALEIQVETIKSESLSTMLCMFSYIHRNFAQESPNNSKHLHLSYSGPLNQEYESAYLATEFLNEWPKHLLESLHMKIAAQKNRYMSSIARPLIVGLTSSKMPGIFRQLGNSLIESARLLYGVPFRVDSKTLQRINTKATE